MARCPCASNPLPRRYVPRRAMASLERAGGSAAHPARSEEARGGRSPSAGRSACKLLETRRRSNAPATGAPCMPEGCATRIAYGRALATAIEGGEIMARAPSRSVPSHPSTRRSASTAPTAHEMSPKRRPHAPGMEPPRKPGRGGIGPSTSNLGETAMLPAEHAPGLNEGARHRENHARPSRWLFGIRRVRRRVATTPFHGTWLPEAYQRMGAERRRLAFERRSAPNTAPPTFDGRRDVARHPLLAVGERCTAADRLGQRPVGSSERRHRRVGIIRRSRRRT